ncbi:hypothetical protein D3C85_605860 [compost metagenome]
MTRKVLLVKPYSALESTMRSPGCRCQASIFGWMRNTKPPRLCSTTTRAIWWQRTCEVVKASAMSVNLSLASSARKAWFW